MFPAGTTLAFGVEQLFVMKDCPSNPRLTVPLMILASRLPGVGGGRIIPAQTQWPLHWHTGVTHSQGYLPSQPQCY